MHKNKCEFIMVVKLFFMSCHLVPRAVCNRKLAFQIAHLLLNTSLWQLSTSHSQIKVFQIIWCSFFNDVFFVSFESILYEGISPNSSINWLNQCIVHFVSFPCVKVHFELGIIASALNFRIHSALWSLWQLFYSQFTAI